MKLANTEKLVGEMLADKTFGTYAILVYKGGDRAVLTSADADEDTYFDVASMGKVLVTSTLILKSADKGLLSLSDTLDMFFVNVPEEKKKITVFQLLTHTAGIIRIPIPDRVADSGKDSVVTHILAHPLKFAPGTDYTYSCNGYILLGYILEKLYGMTLDKIYNEYVVKPLSLTRSKFNISKDEPNAAVNYRWRDMGIIRSDDENAYTLGGVAGNGASFSSLADIEKYIKAVLEKSEKLYSKKWFDLAEKDYTPDFEVGRGLGYLMPDERYHQTGKLFPKGSFGHCGHCGHSFFINRELDMYVVILTNATRFANMKNNFGGYDYGDIMKMREKLHNAVKSDLDI